MMFSTIGHYLYILTRKMLLRDKWLLIVLLIVSTTTIVEYAQAASIVQFQDTYEASLKIENPCEQLDLIKEWAQT